MKSRRAKQQQGFTVMQMVITIAIIAIVSTFGVMGIRTARAEFRVQSSARLFASYIEKARADSVRRHAATGGESWVQSSDAGNNTYQINMDFGNGVVQTRTFQLDPDVQFGTAAWRVTFDWRGRLITQCPVTLSCVYQVVSTVTGTSIPVDVSGSGDITVAAQHFPDGLIPDFPLTPVGDGDIVPEPVGTPVVEGTPSPDPIDPIDPTDPTPTPTATPHGNGNGSGGDNGNNGNGNNPTPTPTPTPTSTPTPSPGAGASPSPVVQCSLSLSSPSLVLSQSIEAKKTGSVNFTVANGSGVRIISAIQQGNGNSLTIGLSLVRIDGNGSGSISITTKHGSGNRGVFNVIVAATPACGSSQTLQVTVDN
jgi:type II secretory pathway pseudopilin PulG